MKAEPPQRRSPQKGRQSDLVVRNLQRRHVIDPRRLRTFLSDVAASVGREQCSATVALVSDERIRDLNRRFRGYDEPTDVLSFQAGGPEQDGYLGDIVISVETAFRQARRRGSSLPRELRVLTLHGFLHLLGYDHETDDGQMRRVEYRLRRRFRISRRRAGAGAK
jgi:probable rRNA maturation factor